MNSLYEKCANRPMIVAELSGNHNGSLQRAMDLMDLPLKTERMPSRSKLILKIP